MKSTSLRGPRNAPGDTSSGGMCLRGPVAQGPDVTTSGKDTRRATNRVSVQGRKLVAREAA